MKNKILFIGSARIHEAFVEMLPDYDFQKPIETIEEFFTEMQNPNSDISFDVQSILLFSRLFDTESDYFARAVAFYAPHALVSILIPDEDILKGKQSTIEIAIKREQSKQEGEALSRGETYEVDTPFFFVKYEDAKVGLITAMSEYVASSYVDKELKANIIEMLPASYREVVQPDDKFDLINDGSEGPFVIEAPDKNAKGKVITVTSSKGGSGKSTVSLGLASYIKKSSRIAVETGVEDRELKVIVIDLDTRDGQLGFLVGKRKPTIFNIMEATPASGVNEEAIMTGVYQDPRSGCDYIFAPRRARNASNIEPSFYGNLIQKLRSMYDVIVVDTSVNFTDDLLSKIAYPLADKIAFVTDMGISSVMGMARWVQETTDPISANGSGIDKGKIGIVVNKVMNDVQMGPDKIQIAARGIPIIAMLPSVPFYVTFKANTASLHELHENRIINAAMSILAKTIVDQDEYTLPEVPYKE